jgi:hypothetical protein
VAEALVWVEPFGWAESEALNAALADGHALAQRLGIPIPGLAAEPIPGLAAEPSHGRSSEDHSAQLLTAEGMEQATGVSASWFESAANRGDIPSIKFGRWRRFDLQQVLQSGALHGKERVIGQAQVRKVDELPVARRSRTRN